MIVHTFLLQVHLFDELPHEYTWCYGYLSYLVHVPNIKCLADIIIDMDIFLYCSSRIERKIIYPLVHLFTAKCNVLWVEGPIVCTRVGQTGPSFTSKPILIILSKEGLFYLLRRIIPYNITKIKNLCDL